MVHIIELEILALVQMNTQDQKMTNKITISGQTYAPSAPSPPKPTTEPWEQMPALLVVWLQHTVMICLTDHAWLMFADTTWLVAS